MGKSHRSFFPHPNAHTNTGPKWIRDYRRRNPHISVYRLYVITAMWGGRNHRNDQERSNSIPMQVLGWKSAWNRNKFNLSLG